MVMFSTWKSWYLLLNVFIQYISSLSSKCFTITFWVLYQYIFLYFSFDFGLDFIWTNTYILFSIDHHWINLCWSTFLVYLTQVVMVLQVTPKKSTQQHTFQTNSFLMYVCRLCVRFRLVTLCCRKTPQQLYSLIPRPPAPAPCHTAGRALHISETKKTKQMFSWNAFLKCVPKHLYVI